jgi:hypothetical protein
VLAVGDSTQLEIIFSTRRYKSQVSKKPTIRTNEGAPDKHVQISANVIQRPDSTYPIIIEPYKLDLSQFSDKVVKEKKFTVRNVSDQKLKISLVSQPGGLFDLEVPRSIKPGKSSGGKLKLKEEAYGETFQKSVTIEVVEVEDEKVSRFTIPVKRSIHVAKAPSDTTAVSKSKASP